MRTSLASTSGLPMAESDLKMQQEKMMKRKDVSINKVYDARALRVIVRDKNGSPHGPAVQCCYSLLDIVHRGLSCWISIHSQRNGNAAGRGSHLFGAHCRLWTAIDGEFDDYIVNPKASGFQRMNEYAEHGLAAHWLYKESGNWLPSASNMGESESSPSKDLEDSQAAQGDLFQKYGALKAGHPVLRVEGSRLLLL